MSNNTTRRDQARQAIDARIAVLAASDQPYERDLELLGVINRLAQMATDSRPARRRQFDALLAEACRTIEAIRRNAQAA